MRLSSGSVCVVVALAVTSGQSVRAQSQQSTPGTPTIKVTSALVFLDVTVFPHTKIAFAAILFRCAQALRTTSTSVELCRDI